MNSNNGSTPAWYAAGTGFDSHHRTDWPSFFLPFLPFFFFFFQALACVTQLSHFLACALRYQRDAALRSMAGSGGVTLMLQLQRAARAMQRKARRNTFSERSTEH